MSQRSSDTAHRKDGGARNEAIMDRPDGVRSGPAQSHIHDLPLPHRKRVPRGTYQNRSEAMRAYRERNRERIRYRLRHWKYSRLKYEAKRRGLEFTLTRDEFIAIRTGAVCHYCGGSLPEYGYGIDRVNSRDGYTRENVVPCCRLCNTVKADELTYSEMVELGLTVAAIRRRRSSAHT